jgi:hypothetical protein
MRTLEIAFTTGTEEDWDQAEDFVNVDKVVFLSCSLAFAFSAIIGSIFRAICDIIMDCIGVINKANITLHTRAIVLTMLEKLAKDQNEAWEADFIKRSIGAPND